MLVRFCQWSLLAAAFAVTHVHAVDTTRIVSVGGSATEMVFALGLGDSIVAVDVSSVYPPQKVGPLPKVGYVRGLSAEGILAMRPTVIVGSDEIGPPPVKAQLLASGVPVVIVPSPQSLAEIGEALAQLGTDLGLGEKGAMTAQRYAADVETLGKMIGATNAKRIAFLLQAPAEGGSARVAGANTRGHALIEMIGGTNVFAELSGYSSAPGESIVSAQPEIILIGQAQGLSDGVSSPVDFPAFAATPAAQNDHIHMVDLGQYLSFGPRQPRMAAQLATKLHASDD